MEGMKPADDGSGRKVPNCIPVGAKKSDGGYEGCGCPECKAEDIPCELCDTCNPAVVKANEAKKMWQESPFFN